MRSSVHAAKDNPKDELIRPTRQVWQPRLRRDLRGEDARQIAENARGLFAVLAEWARAEMPAPAKDGRPEFGSAAVSARASRCARTAGPDPHRRASKEMG